MFTLIFLLYSLTFHVYSDEGPGICPHGGKSMTTTADRAGAFDPNGATADIGGALDPNG